MLCCRWKWKVLVVDEAHRLKNQSSLLRRALTEVNTAPCYTAPCQPLPYHAPPACPATPLTPALLRPSHLPCHAPPTCPVTPLPPALSRPSHLPCHAPPTCPVTPLPPALSRPSHLPCHAPPTCPVTPLPPALSRPSHPRLPVCVRSEPDRPGVLTAVFQTPLPLAVFGALQSAADGNPRSEQPAGSVLPPQLHPAPRLSRGQRRRLRLRLRERSNRAGSR